MNPTSNDVSTARGKVARWRTWLLLLLMAGLCGLLAWEAPNYFAYRKTHSRLEAEWMRRRNLELPLQRDEIAPFIAGSPQKLEVNDPNIRADYYSWLGLLYDFHLCITFNESGALNGIEESPSRFYPEYLAPVSPERPPQQQVTTQKQFTTQEVDDVLETVIWRNYQANGHGGLFPLKNAKRDQTKVEIWYQLAAYLQQ